MAPQSAVVPHQRQQDAPQFGPSTHVYGKGAALCFQTNVTRGNVPTLNIDAAASLRPREYDWDNKVIIQLTRQELPVVTGVFLGLIKSCEYKNHGPDNNKGFSFENQQNGVFGRVFTKGAAHAVPITKEDVFYVAGLLLEQVRAGNPAIKTAADAVTVIRHTVCRFT